MPLLTDSAVSEEAPADQMFPPGAMISGFSFKASVTPQEVKLEGPLSLLLESCTDTERIYAEQLLKTFLIAMNARDGDPENPLTKEDAPSEDGPLS